MCFGAPAVRPAFTLVELMVVVAVIGILIGIMLPSVTRMLADRRATDAETMLGGVLSTARQRANVNNIDSGLFFMIDPDTGVQKIFPIERDPPHPLKANDDGVYGSDAGAERGTTSNVGADTGDDVTGPAAIDRFRVTDGRVFSLPKPMRACPLSLVNPLPADGGTARDSWSAEEINNEDVTIRLASVEPQRHRNFFTVVFEQSGRVRAGRPVVIMDEDAQWDDSNDPGHEIGDHTGMAVRTDVAQYQPLDDDSPVDFTGSVELHDLIVDQDGTAINFMSVDGLLVYNDDAMRELPIDGDDTLRRNYILDSAQPLYFARLSGAVVRGPKGENR